MGNYKSAHDRGDTSVLTCGQTLVNFIQEQSMTYRQNVTVVATYDSFLFREYFVAWAAHMKLLFDKTPGAGFVLLAPTLLSGTSRVVDQNVRLFFNMDELSHIESTHQDVVCVIPLLLQIRSRTISKETSHANGAVLLLEKKTIYLFTLEPLGVVEMGPFNTMAILDGIQRAINEIWPDVKVGTVMSVTASAGCAHGLQRIENEQSGQKGGNCTVWSFLMLHAFLFILMGCDQTVHSKVDIRDMSVLLRYATTDMDLIKLVDQYKDILVHWAADATFEASHVNTKRRRLV